MSLNFTTSRSAEYKTWDSMIQRCYNPNCRMFPHYGARGITVCDRWRASADNFVVDIGIRPDGMSLDRIDVNGNYTLANCRWATTREQSRNRRDNVWLTYDGETMIMTDWARRIGVKPNTLHHRFVDGWTDAEIISTPVGLPHRPHQKPRKKTSR
jgi:hypothetical protein